MRYGSIPGLRCPKTGGRLTVFGLEVERRGAVLSHRAETELEPGDEIRSGLLLEPRGGAIYPIAESIAVLVSAADLPDEEVSRHLPPSGPALPGPFREALEARRRGGGAEGGPAPAAAWNQGEAAFFDRDVATPEQRASFAADIREEALWNRYLPRERFLLRPLRGEIRGRSVLEVGCGNARSVARLLPPARHGFAYWGADISFKRLVLAKAVIPEGEFVQCSAANLPFPAAVFDGVIGFGIFHHLPDPGAGLAESLRVLRPPSFLALHEPIRKSRRSREAGANPRDGAIDLDRFLAVLAERGFVVRSRRGELSPPGTIGQALLGRMPSLARRRFPHRALMALDRLVIGRRGRGLPGLRPAGVLLLAVRSVAPESPT